MSKKNKKLYECVFEKLKDLRDNINPMTIISDFESGILFKTNST